eukprot:1195722-Prorocentrum_minimum.AAC.11
MSIESLQWGGFAISSVHRHQKRHSRAVGLRRVSGPKGGRECILFRFVPRRRFRRGLINGQFSSSVAHFGPLPKTGGALNSPVVRGRVKGLTSLAGLTSDARAGYSLAVLGLVDVKDL